MDTTSEKTEKRSCINCNLILLRGVNYDDNSNIIGECTMTTHCLCTLPAQRTPYTCLCLYAISNVPNCNSCSAPCTTVEPNCCEENAYLRVLHVLDIALHSCTPLVCCSSLYDELIALQTDSTPITCQTALGEYSTSCTGSTYNEHQMEQQTTLILYLAQQSQQQDLPMYNHMSLIPYMLHQSVLQQICTSPTNDNVSLLRTLYLAYQRMKTILQYNKMAMDINNMDNNALQYILTKHQNNMMWLTQEKNKLETSTAIYTAGSQLRDNENNREALQHKIEHTKTALDASGTYKQNVLFVRHTYSDIVQKMETLLSSMCKVFVKQWLSVGCDGHIAECERVSSYSTVTMELQRVRTMLEQLNTQLQQKELERQWKSSSYIVANTSPALDMHLIKWGKLHIRVESNSRMRECMKTFLNTFFCDDGSVKGAYVETLWNHSTCQLKTHMSQLRHTVALAEAMDHGV